MHKILVSRCLLGHRVRYDGGASGPFDLLEQWIEEGRVVPLCPEVAGGLPTPRAAADPRHHSRRSRRGAAMFLALAAAVHFAPLPYNLFLVAAVWRQPASAVHRWASLAWLDAWAALRAARWAASCCAQCR